MASLMEVSPSRSSDDGTASLSTAGTTPPNDRDAFAQPALPALSMVSAALIEDENNAIVPAQDVQRSGSVHKETSTDENAQDNGMVAPSNFLDIIRHFKRRKEEAEALVESQKDEINSLKKAVQVKEDENQRGIDAYVEEIGALNAQWEEKMAKAVAEAGKRRDAVPEETQSSQLEALNDKLVGHKNLVLELDTKMSDLKLSHEKTQSELKKNLNSFKSLAEDRQAALAAKEDELKVVLSRCQVLVSEKASLQSVLDTSRAECSSQATNIARLNKDVEKLMAEKAELKGKSVFLRDEVQRHVNMRSQLDVARSTLKTQGLELERQKQKLRQSEQESKAKLQAANEKVKEKEQKVRDDKIKIQEECQIKVRGLESALEKKDAQIQESRHLLRAQGFFMAAMLVVQVILLLWLVGNVLH